MDLESQTDHYGDPNSSDVLYFDGNCAFCSFAVRFLNKRLHRKRKLRFVGQETKIGQTEIAKLPGRVNAIDSVILFRSGKAYIRSAATIRALLHLRQPWPLLFPILWVIPAPIRDLFYIGIAKIRHKIQLRKMNRS